MYEIRPESVKTFIEDRKIKFPRFQRKQTWDSAGNFKLCISVFKNYPIGVIVINKEDSNVMSTRWLLDGRQRRNALINMLENPEKIYEWSKKFIGFKSSDQPYKVEEKFWEKIQEHLEDNNKEDDGFGEIAVSTIENTDMDKLDDDIENNDQSEEKEDEYDQEDVVLKCDDNDFNLKLLLRIILLVHNKGKSGSGFTSPFDFSKYVDNLEYIDYMPRATLNPKKLMTFIKDFKNYIHNDNIEEPTQEYLYEYLIFRYKVDNSKKNKLKSLVKQNWDKIEERLRIIELIDSKIQATIIGIIEVKNVEISDAQNIFKLINSEGTQLMHEEILSAKPSWNRRIKNPSEDLLRHVKELYNRLGFPYNEIVRWDFPATLLGRLNELNFIFKKLSYDKDKEFEKRISLGFKIISALYKGSISKKTVADLAISDNINWNSDLEAIVADLNLAGKILLDHSFYKYLMTWKSSLMDISSDSIALNFLVLIYKDWLRKNKPVGNNNRVKKFQKNSLVLFDKLIYEYVTSQWQGSTDTKLSNNIEAFNSTTTPDVLTPIGEDKWKSLISDIIDKCTINDVQIKMNQMRALLYYSYCLDCKAGPDAPDIEIHTDHIIPQSLFGRNTASNATRDNLFNLALLPQKENITKKDKLLRHIDNQWLITEIEKYTGISQGDFDKYSDLGNLNDLREKRKDHFLNIFINKRNFLFNE